VTSDSRIIVAVMSHLMFKMQGTHCSLHDAFHLHTFQTCGCSALPFTSYVESNFFWWSTSRSVWDTTLWVSKQVV